MIFLCRGWGALRLRPQSPILSYSFLFYPRPCRILIGILFTGFGFIIFLSLLLENIDKVSEEISYVLRQRLIIISNRETNN